MMKKLLALFFLTTILNGCASRKPIDTVNLPDIQNMTQQKINASKMTVAKIRYQALKETALSVGAQGGLAFRSQQINAVLVKESPNLDSIYNFGGLMLDNNILPPVLEESTQSLKLDNINVIRASDHLYKIIFPAKFVTASPNWRNYLIMNFERPDVPDSTLLPRDSSERNIWHYYSNYGWNTGIEQANTIYSENLSRINRDFQGMILYRKLLSYKMVSKPFVAKMNMGITSNDDRTEMRINDRVLRITSTPRLNPKQKSWKALVVQ